MNNVFANQNIYSMYSLKNLVLTSWAEIKLSYSLKTPLHECLKAEEQNVDVEYCSG